MNPKYKVQFDKLDWIEPGDGIRYKCFQQAGFQVRLVEFTQKMVHADWCLKGHYAYLIAGKLEIQFSGKTEVYEPGDVIFIPDGEEHQHRPGVLSEKVLFFSVEELS